MRHAIAGASAGAIALAFLGGAFPSLLESPWAALGAGALVGWLPGILVGVATDRTRDLPSTERSFARFLAGILAGAVAEYALLLQLVPIGRHSYVWHFRRALRLDSLDLCGDPRDLEHLVLTCAAFGGGIATNAWGRDRGLPAYVRGPLAALTATATLLATTPSWPRVDARWIAHAIAGPLAVWLAGTIAGAPSTLNSARDPS